MKKLHKHFKKILVTTITIVATILLILFSTIIAEAYHTGCPYVTGATVSSLPETKYNYFTVNSSGGARDVTIDVNGATSVSWYDDCPIFCVIDCSSDNEVIQGRYPAALSIDMIRNNASVGNGFKWGYNTRYTYALLPPGHDEHNKHTQTDGFVNVNTNAQSSRTYSYYIDTQGITPYLILPQISREGYTFTGWQINYEGTAYINETQDSTQKVIAVWTNNNRSVINMADGQQCIYIGAYTDYSTIQAQWTPNVYTQTTNHYLYNPNTGNWDYWTTTYNNATYDTMFYPSYISAPTGYHAHSTSTPYIVKGALTSGCYYYPDSYTISLSGDSGVASTSGSGSYLYGTTAYTTATLKEGYHFSHVTGTDGSTGGQTTWYSPDGINGNVVYLNWGVTRNRYFTVYTAPNTYTVRFNANNGSGATATQSMTYNSSASLTTPGFTKEGYKLVGWNTSPNNTGTPYSLGQTVSNLTSVNGGVIDLYAVWEYKDYTVQVNVPSINGITEDALKYSTTKDGLAITYIKPNKNYTVLSDATVDGNNVHQLYEIKTTFENSNSSYNFNVTETLNVCNSSLSGIPSDLTNVNKTYLSSGSNGYFSINSVNNTQNTVFPSFGCQSLTRGGVTTLTAKNIISFAPNGGRTYIKASVKVGAYSYGVNETTVTSKTGDALVVEVDNTAPMMSFNITTEDWTKESVDIATTATDSQSGFKKYVLYLKDSNGNWTAVEESTNPAYTKQFTDEGYFEYKLCAYDNLDNIYTKPFTVKIDKTVPSINDGDHPIIRDEIIYDWTNQDISLNFNVSDEGSGIKSIELIKDGSVIATNNAALHYTFDKEGISITNLKITDNALNVLNIRIIAKIDKTKPQGSSEISVTGASDFHITDSSWGVEGLAVDDKAIYATAYDVISPNTGLFEHSGLKSLEIFVAKGVNDDDDTLVEPYLINKITNPDNTDISFTAIYKDVVHNIFDINDGYYKDCSEVYIACVATDIAGNSAVVDYTSYKTFYVSVEVERAYPSDKYADYEFLAGEKGIAHINVYGYVESIDIKFSEELEEALIYQKEHINSSITTNLSRVVLSKNNIALNPKLYEQLTFIKNGFPETYDNEYSDTSGIEGYDFYVPIYLNQGSYGVFVTAHKGEETVEDEAWFDVKESILEHFRTRIRRNKNPR